MFIVLPPLPLSPPPDFLSRPAKLHCGLPCKTLFHQWLIRPDAVTICRCETQSVRGGKAASSPANVSKEDVWILAFLSVQVCRVNLGKLTSRMRSARTCILRMQSSWYHQFQSRAPVSRRNLATWRVVGTQLRCCWWHNLRHRRCYRCLDICERRIWDWLLFHQGSWPRQVLRHFRQRWMIRRSCNYGT
jgi:hypothetical protein